MKRRDARGPYVERLDPAGLDTSALIGLPVLDGHRQGGARDVVGSIAAARMEDGRLVVTIRKTSAADAAPIWDRVADGTMKGVSIGYGVTRWAETTEGGQRVRTGRPVIREVSIVAIPADPQAIIRQEDNTMPKDTNPETEDRAALIQRCRAAHPALGDEWATRMAMALALYTGQRRSDLVQFGKQHVRDGWLTFTQFKGRENKPVRLELPIIPELQRIIDASPTGDLAYLVTAYGKPFTAAGFGNRMRAWCDKAGLPDCSTHGLRKAVAARLAEPGCTEFEIMAITGCQTSKKAIRYTKAASQRLRTKSALAKLTGTRS